MNIDERKLIINNDLYIMKEKMDLQLLKSKFRGSMLGVLMGDCLGAPYENEELLSKGSKLVLEKSFNKLESPVKFKAPVMQYTDDSAMTKCVAESLIEKKDIDLIDLAKRFVKCYYLEPFRGYGPGVITVFHKLRGNKFQDVLHPAKEQFNGQGSWGNGGAMRIAPVSLFSFQNYDKLLDLTRRATEITHTHKTGIDGAILQALAIQQCLGLNPKDGLNVSHFLKELIDKMDKIEEDEEGLDLDEPQPYKLKLETMQDFITSEKDLNDDLVIRLFGNSIAALHSVPTAIFCFLRAQQPIKDIETDNPLRRAIQYAITLGGDTDTIGSMTGALAGAFYGEDYFNSNLMEHCEASKEFAHLGEKLLDATLNQ
ncbi:PREDICTED: poly(ADP-ribose) glycohydrolase ARH3-like isoform X2 [Polistes dominula]|uniref:ADP-ribosylhydrolase ARH3 n=2 Tax=Polistes dominula TaxID=743375 RepID=A0ABM1J4N5_POLDO|nr:PREDICTED: poly(ADP-ribose) glycohydrolase ARH3-like isoform X2 [Polistes dominula]